jgi:hypothetical protein
MDGYNRTLTKYVLARDLWVFNDHEGVVDNPENRATWAFLRELPADAKIALWWN